MCEIHRISAFFTSYVRMTLVCEFRAEMGVFYNHNLKALKNTLNEVELESLTFL
jgi:hypothetical protein